MVHRELSESATSVSEGIDDGLRRFGWRDPFMDVDEARRSENRNLEVSGERAVPGNETILEIGDRIAVWMFDKGTSRFCCYAFPCERIVRRKPRQWADIPYDS